MWFGSQVGRRLRAACVLAMLLAAALGGIVLDRIDAAATAKWTMPGMLAVLAALCVGVAMACRVARSSGDAGAVPESAADAMLAHFMRENKRVLDAAHRGNFNERIDLSVLCGLPLEMGENLNRLMARCGTGLDDAVRIMTAVSEGDLSKRIELSGAGVFPELNESVNRAVSRLALTMRSIDGSALVWAGRSDAMLCSAHDLSQNLDAQAHDMVEVRAAIDDLTASMTHSVKLARVAGRAACQMDEDALLCGAALQQSAMAIAQIANQIGLIDDIARQANRLALDAVAAAGAGVEARDFAALAADAHLLAARSQTLASGIGQVLADGAGKADHAGTLFQRMMPNLRKTVDLAQEIAHASKEQALQAGTITTSMRHFSRVVQGNAARGASLARKSEGVSVRAEQLLAELSFFRPDSDASIDVGECRPVLRLVQGTAYAQTVIEPEASRV